MPIHHTEHRQIQNNPGIESEESADHHLRLISIRQADQPVTAHLTTAVTCCHYFENIFKSLRTYTDWPMQSSMTEFKRQIPCILTRNTTLYTEQQWPLAPTQQSSLILQLEEETLDKEKSLNCFCQFCTFCPSPAQPSAPLLGVNLFIPFSTVTG